MRVDTRRIEEWTAVNGAEIVPTVSFWNTGKLAFQIWIVRKLGRIRVSVSRDAF
jgi:hypothetical protein